MRNELLHIIVDELIQNEQEFEDYLKFVEDQWLMESCPV